jgi:UDP-glucose-4-epimerase GalE
MSKAILVTGGAGYIGSHACKALARAGYHPVTYDNLLHGHREVVKWGPLVIGDVADHARLVAAMTEHQVAAVIHFAALINVGESMSHPMRYFRNNAANTFVLLDAMREAEVGTIVFSSTCATYGMPIAVPITEDHPQSPINAYGESKLMVERALAWSAGAYGLRYAALRYFNASGADPDGETGENHDPETHLIPLVLRSALGLHPQIDIYGTDYPTPDGTAVRDYVHVQDLAEAHVKAVGHLLDGNDSLALNLGTGRGYSVREVIAAAERVTGRAVPRREMPRRAGDPPALVADPRRVNEILGWTPHMSDIDTIVDTAWRWTQKLESARAAA